MADTFISTFELSKTNGVTIIVDNPGKKIVQTIHLDGEKITTTVDKQGETSTIEQSFGKLLLKVKGTSKTSTVTQTDTEVHVDCQDFRVTADTVQVASKKATSFDSKDTYSVSSAKAMSLKSKASLLLDSKQAMNLKTKANLTAKATGNLTCQGRAATMKGQMTATLEGGTGATVKGLKVEVKGTAKAALEGAMTTVGQQMTTIRGTLVKIEAAAVKLG